MMTKISGDIFLFGSLDIHAIFGVRPTIWVSVSFRNDPRNDHQIWRQKYQATSPFLRGKSCLMGAVNEWPPKTMRCFEVRCRGQASAEFIQMRLLWVCCYLSTAFIWPHISSSGWMGSYQIDIAIITNWPKLNEIYCNLINIALKFVRKIQLDNKSFSGWAMAKQATGHFLNKCWPNLLTPICVFWHHYANQILCKTQWIWVPHLRSQKMVKS